MMPIIVFKRDSLEKNRSLANKLDANMPNLYTSWQKSYNVKNIYCCVPNDDNYIKKFIPNNYYNIKIHKHLIVRCLGSTLFEPYYL